MYRRRPLILIRCLTMIRIAIRAAPKAIRPSSRRPFVVLAALQQPPSHSLKTHSMESSDNARRYLPRPAVRPREC